MDSSSSLAAWHNDEFPLSVTRGMCNNSRTLLLVSLKVCSAVLNASYNKTINNDPLHEALKRQRHKAVSLNLTSLLMHLPIASNQCNICLPLAHHNDRKKQFVLKVFRIHHVWNVIKGIHSIKPRLRVDVSIAFDELCGSTLSQT